MTSLLDPEVYDEWYGSAKCAYHSKLEEARAAELAATDWRDLHGFEGDDG